MTTRITRILAIATSFGFLPLLACSTSEDGDDEIGDTDESNSGSDTSAGESGESGTDGDASSTTDTSDANTSADTDTGPGDLIGEFVLTYYWFLLEADYEGPDTTELLDVDCNPIANVPEQFAAEVCVEGSGKLTSGEVLNYADECDCGYPCSSGPNVCFALLDPTTFPWGSGSTDNPLEPLRSWAVDESEIPHGTVVYAPGWDGVEIPAIDGIGGFTHDGCFRADDVGNGIDGMHIDLFAGTTSMWEALEQEFPSLEIAFAVYQNSPACAGFGG
ncbi:3D domain-containing protein [Nannocystaceae bacterium ST9]